MNMRITYYGNDVIPYKYIMATKMIEYENMVLTKSMNTSLVEYTKMDA